MIILIIIIKISRLGLIIIIIMNKNPLLLIIIHLKKTLHKKLNDLRIILL